MIGQMSIFDYIQPVNIDLETLSDRDMIQIISERTGLRFERIEKPIYSDFEWYESRYGKTIFGVHYSRFYGSNEKYISTSYISNMSGAGCPITDINKSIEILQTWIEKENHKRQSNAKAK